MLKKIAKRINKELEQARDYIHQAFMVKENSQPTADLFATLSEEELVHAEKLVREGQRIVNKEKSYPYSKSGKTSEPEEDEAWREKCKVIWEWETRIAMEQISECRKMISAYHGG